jgi:proteasome lid subunit RPN8/RPN11
LRIDRGVREAIVTHALDEAPNECCGLLVGGESGIDESVRTRSVVPSPLRYQVDPVEHIALNRRLRGTGRLVVGAYHSHPHSAAVPSPTDVAEAHYPDFVYVIVSLADPARPDVRAYRIRDGRVSALSLEEAG